MYILFRMHSYFTTQTRPSTFRSVEIRYAPGVEITEIIRGILDMMICTSTTGVAFSMYVPRWAYRFG